MGSRQVRPQSLIAGQREAVAIAATLGGAVRASRRSMRLTLVQLGARAGLSRARLSQIERGDGQGAPLAVWIALGVAIGRPLAVGLSKSMDPDAALVDAGHLQIQEYLLELARATGRPGTFELASGPSDRRSTDIGIRDDRQRVLTLAECWNTFGDLGAAVRSSHRKQADAEALAIASQRAGTAAPYRVATVWVVRSSAANRAILARYPHVIAAAFPGSSRGWVRALRDGDEPPVEPGLVWFDPAAGRLTDWRRRRA